MNMDGQIDGNEIIPKNLRAKMLSKPHKLSEINELICKYLCERLESTINVANFALFVTMQVQEFLKSDPLKHYSISKLETSLIHHILNIFDNASDFKVVDIYKSNSCYHISFEPIYKSSFTRITRKLLGF